MFRYILLLNILLVSLFANVKITAPNSFLKDELYIFSIEVNGSNIVFPKIDNIDGNVVNEIGSSSSTNIINGRISKSIRKNYSLLASKEFTIPSLEFEVDGKSFFTKEKKVLQQKVEKTKSNIFDLTIKANKNELFVGEDFILTLIFKYRKDAQITDLNLSKPSFDGFWYKQLEESKKYEENNFVVQELNYLLFPLQSGSLKIEPLFINASLVDFNRNFNSFFSTPTKQYKIYSNALNLNIKALPMNIDLIGDFTVEASIDKNSIKNGEAISYKVKIAGSGNIEDIKDIKLSLDNATIYENKAKIKATYINGKYKGTYDKTFSIIPSKTLVIPPIELKYFDENKNEIITKRTKSFNIYVENQIEKQNIVLEKKKESKEVKKVEVIKESSFIEKVIYFLLGIVFSVLILCLYLYVINQRKKKEFIEQPLVKKIKKSKNKEELLKVLVVYLNMDKKLDKLIFDLEKSDNIESIKKEVIKLLKSLNFKG